MTVVLSSALCTGCGDTFRDRVCACECLIGLLLRVDTTIDEYTGPSAREGSFGSSSHSVIALVLW